MDRLESDQAEFHERMAHLEGPLEGLRETTVHRSADLVLSSTHAISTRETDEASVVVRGLVDFFIRAAAMP
ncbi:MAG: hypothetical protein OXF88_11790 [Rhodobacteraceae bacterium]|nr:hypothetical protein [Paracoccaceae bacterium]